MTKEYGIIGEKYVLNVKIENFTKDEFLGATAFIIIPYGEIHIYPILPNAFLSI